MKENYHLKMLEEIEKIKDLTITPTLLLHSCCAPCSTRALSLLAEYFSITVFYYNPNIEPEIEYIKRKNEQIRFINEFQNKNSISYLECDWENEKFLKISKGLEQEREGGLRCPKCFLLRLEETARVAKEKRFDYFATTLTVSPHKNSQMINEIGEFLQSSYQIPYLYSDFKKEQGYLKSIEYSKQYHLYRQDYCGCLFSREDKNKNEN